LNALHELTYLIYWYGAEDKSSYYGYAVPNKFVPYDVERKKSKSVHQMPAHIETKLAKNISLDETEMAKARQYHEMEEDLRLEPNQRRRGMSPFDGWSKHRTSQDSHIDNAAVDTQNREDAKMAASPASIKDMRAVKTEAVPVANGSAQSSMATALGLAVLPADDTAQGGSASAASTRKDDGTGAQSVADTAPSQNGARQSDLAVNVAPSQEGDTVFHLYLNCYLGLKDQQRALLNECEALVGRKKELDSELATLSDEVHLVDTSIEVVEAGNDKTLEGTLALLAMDASAKEDHGHCPDQMKALLDRASEEVKEASKLKIQLGDQIEQQKLALASQSHEFHAGKARLARIDALREQHLASLPEIFRKARSGE
jgi:hypothetical protein